jgi:hypothetical protein
VKSIGISLKPLIAATFLTCVACGGGYTVVESGPDPYPPAYAYRYRHPHDRILLVYDPAIRVYTVTGYPNYYYSGGRYYRLKGNSWYRTSRLDGPWRVVTYKSVPPGLQKKYYKAKPVKEKKSPAQTRKHPSAQKKYKG